MTHCKQGGIVSPLIAFPANTGYKASIHLFVRHARQTTAHVDSAVAFTGVHSFQGSLHISKMAAKKLPWPRK